MSEHEALLEQALNDGSDVIVEVRYRGHVRRCGGGVRCPVILTNPSGQEFIFERAAITSVRHFYPDYWPPRDGELWVQPKRGYVIHWVCGLGGEEEDGGWVLYPNDPSEEPIGEKAFTGMTPSRQEEFLAGMQLVYSQERSVYSRQPSG